MAKRFIFYDTETTGVNRNNDRIIELGAFDPEKKKTFNELINPNVPIPAAASNIHHISDDMVKDKPTFAEVGKRFLEFCDGEVILVAHNNDAFDKHFIEAEYKRANVELKEFLYFDTLKWARKYRSDLPRHSLQYLREVYDIPSNQAHRALDDVMILYEVFVNMTGDLSTEMIYNLLLGEKDKVVMPFGKHAGKPLAEVPKHYISWLKDNGALDKDENKDLLAKLQKLKMV